MPLLDSEPSGPIHATSFATTHWSVVLTLLPAKAITRSFQSISEAEDEAQLARVTAGIHFHEGCVAGGTKWGAS